MPPEAQNAETEQPEDDLRSVIESAYDDAADDGEEGRPAADAPQSVRPAEEGAEAGTDADGPVRDEHGRFAPKTKAKTKLTEPPREGEVAPKTVATQQPEGDERTEAAPTYDKAPASWKPGAREAWGALAPEVRAEIHRRESETAQVLERTATARRVYEHMSELQNKYAPALQAEGVDVMQATENLMGMAATMRFGTPLEKARTAAQIIQTYGVDILALDQLLSQAPQQPQPDPQQAVPRDPRVDQLFQRLEQAQRQRIEETERAAAEEVENFGRDKEFFEDVREDMADMLEVAAKRGLELSLEDAYTRACQLQPEIRKVLDARAAAAQAGTRKGSTQRARKAASSVHGKPAAAPSTSGPDTLRAAIENAIDEAEGR